MDTFLRDPLTNDGMKISTLYRGQTDAVSIVEEDLATITGRKYNINTGNITLTNATKTTVLYVKNTDQHDMAIDLFVYNLGNASDGANIISGENVVIDIIRNPTTGDIITNANDAAIGPGQSANGNFGSTNTMSGLFYKGASGETAVNGDIHVTTISPVSSGRIALALGYIIIPQGFSIAIDYTPPTGNTSQTCQFALRTHIRTPEYLSGI